MKYLCTYCNYIFDESLWDIGEGIEIWTKIESMKNCPICLEPDAFQWVNEEVNYAEDDSNLKFLEIEHIPQINNLSNERITVSIGLNEHPMWEEHRISSISLYDEYSDLVSEEFLFADSEPKVEFDISDLDEYEIRAWCSVNWLWWKRFKK